MFTFEGAKLGKLHFIYLSRGENVLESIQEEIDRCGVKQGIMLSAIGSARKMVYHRISKIVNENSDEFLTVEAPVEIGAIQGLIIDGKPHLHVTFSDLENTYTGHLEPGCEIQYLAEIVFAEIEDAPIMRKYTETGVGYLCMKD